MPIKFEKLIVWQKALDPSGIVNEIAKGFPKDELFVLTSQIKRAADSVSFKYCRRINWTNKFRIQSVSWYCIAIKY